jgi:hypothetical protein
MQTMVNKILHRKQKIEQYEPHLITEVDAGAPEGEAVVVPRVAASCYPCQQSFNETEIKLTLFG